MSLAAAAALLFFVELYLVWVYVTVCADKNKFVACIEVFRFVSFHFMLSIPNRATTTTTKANMPSIYDFHIQVIMPKTSKWLTFVVVCETPKNNYNHSNTATLAAAKNLCSSHTCCLPFSSVQHGISRNCKVVVVAVLIVVVVVIVCAIYLQTRIAESLNILVIFVFT